MHAYLLLHHGKHTFYRIRAGNVNSVKLLNTFTVSYGDDNVYSNTLVHLERFNNMERGFSLSSMATVVNLSKSNTYHIVQHADVYDML